MDKTRLLQNPWFLTLVAFARWGAGYITADDARIEKENALRCNWTQTATQDKPVKLAMHEEAAK